MEGIAGGLRQDGKGCEEVGDNPYCSRNFSVPICIHSDCALSATGAFFRMVGEISDKAIFSTSHPASPNQNNLSCLQGEPDC
jgi:hypothetical protein